jgi:quinol monooxygenase YgiN
MYGTVALIHPKPDKEKELLEMFDRWWTDRRPKVQGVVSSTVSKQDINPSEWVLAVVFESKEAYQENASDPEQDRWFREMMTLCTKEPTWFDGDVIFHKHV